MEDEEETQEEQKDEPETGEQVAEVASTPVPKQPANEMKVVIVMRGDSILLGVQAPTCDPVYTTMKGDLGAALKRVPSLVDEAKEKWAATPLNPKANLPEPPPPPTPVRTSTAARSASPKAQPAMF